MKSERSAPFSEASNEDATVARRVPQALVLVTAERGPATDSTVSRIETVLELLSLAANSAAAISAAPSSEHNGLRAAMISSALDEALGEQRRIWLELAPQAATGPDGSRRYRDVTGPETRD